MFGSVAIASAGSRNPGAGRSNLGENVLPAGETDPTALWNVPPLRDNVFPAGASVFPTRWNVFPVRASASRTSRNPFPGLWDISPQPRETQKPIRTVPVGLGRFSRGGRRPEFKGGAVFPACWSLPESNGQVFPTGWLISRESPTGPEVELHVQSLRQKTMTPNRAGQGVLGTPAISAPVSKDRE